MSCDSKKCEAAGKICDALGIQYIADIEIEENKETLAMRIDKDQRIKNQQMKFYADEESFEEEMTKRGPWMKKHYYVMGQDITKQTAEEIATTLLSRDAPQFLELTTSNAHQIGAIFTPESYLPSTRFVSPEIRDEILNANPDNKKLWGEKIANDGEMAEKMVEEALWEVYGNAKGGILVIKNITMMKLGVNKKSNAQEVDFFIVNFSNQTITNAEVKSWLGKSDLPLEKWSTTKAKKQLLAIKHIFADWFKEALKGKKWKFISFVACQELDPELKDCKMSDYTAEGKDEVIKKLRSSDMKERKVAENVEKFPEDFILICMYLLYCAPVVALPLGGNYTSAIRKAIEESGSRDNIYIWCYPTPKQRTVLKCSKVVFASPFGAGKTLFETVKAIEISDKGGKVLFLLFLDAANVPSKIKPLLAYDLEEKFKKHPNIKVEVIFFEDGRSDNLKDIEVEGINHVMVDEFFGDFDSLSKESRDEFNAFISDKETAWISLSNTYNYDNRLPDGVGLEVELKSWFPGFEVAKMDKPLRCPLSVAKDMKDEAVNTGKVSQLTFNDKLLAESTLPSNLAEGSFTDFGMDRMELLPQVCQQVFQKVKGNQYALIIINDDPNLPVNQFMRSRIQCQCRDKIAVLPIDVSFQSNGKTQSVFLALGHQSNPEKLLAWTGGKRKEDMVVSFELMKGTEHNLVIDLSDSLDASSRSMAHVMKINSNPVLDMEWVIQNILTPDHDCNEILNWSVRKKISSFSISGLIGSVASKRGFSVSKELPDPYSYNRSNENPILEIVADQANQDPSWPSGHLTGLQLRDLIIDALSDINLEWPMNFGYLTKSQWIKHMKQNPTYYTYQTLNSTVFQAHERLLLQLASKLLKRKICLISLFPEDKDETFEPPMPTSSRPYYLLGCNKLTYYNVYVSILKNESNDPISASNTQQSILSRNFSSNFLFGLITAVTITSFLFYKYRKK